MTVSDGKCTCGAALVLLAIEWLPHPETELRHCPSCGGSCPEDFPPAIYGDVGHKPDCALRQSLEQAGLR